MPASKVAIIGGSGFIGQVLGRQLEKAGVPFRMIDIQGPPAVGGDDFVRADVRDKAALVNALRGTGRIVNLAAVHRDDVRPISLYDEVNVAGSANICDAARELGINDIVFTSSVAVYGFQPGVPDENTAPSPFNDYGRTKWEAEHVYRAWADEAGSTRRLAIVRPTVVFGPGNRGNVYNLMAQLAGRRFVMIGRGENRKSMAYVENVAAFLAHLLLQEPAAGQATYNYVDKPDFTMNELLAAVRGALGKTPRPSVRLPYGAGLAIGTMFDVAGRITGRTFPISAIRVQKFCANTIFAADRLRQTGFKAPYGLAEGLARTLSFEFPSTAKGARPQ